MPPDPSYHSLKSVIAPIWRGTEWSSIADVDEKGGLHGSRDLHPMTPSYMMGWYPNGS